MVAEHGCPRERGRPRLAEHIVDVLVPLIMEEIVEVLKTVFQEQISERICKQIVEQAAEVPKTSSRDRTLQRAAEQIPNVPVPEMVTQLAEVPETVSRDGVQQRTVEQIIDASVPQAVEELAEVSRVFSQDRIQQRAVEQTIENLATSLAEMVVEVLVIQTPERTKQVVNTSVQHVVNTVEVEKPKLVKETVQEKINQVTKHIKIPQVQFLNKVDDMLVDVQRQISPMVQTVQKTIETQQLQCIDKVIDVPVVLVAQVPQLLSNVQAPTMQVVEKTVEDPQLQIVVEKTAKTPESQTIQAQTLESLSIAPVCQRAQAETVEAVEIGAITPTESARPMFVTTPVLETPPVVAEYVQLAPAVVPQGMTQEVLVPVAVPKKLDSPQVQLIDKVVNVPVTVQRQVPSAPKVQKIVEMQVVQLSDGEVDMPVITQRQVPMIPNVQKTVEVPQIQYIDKIVDALVVARSEDVSVGTQTVSRKRKLSMETESADGTSDEEHGLVQEEECESKVDETRVKHAAGEDLDLLPVAPNMEAGGSHLQATAEEERIVDWTQDLREIRRMVEFLVRRERKLDVKADVAVRRLARLEKEHSQQEDEECEVSLPDALADRTKVVKLVVDKWFVDKGLGFGRVPTGEVVFIHASVVRGAEVLTISTDAWVQVVHDDARAQGGGIEHAKLGDTPRGKRRETRRGQPRWQSKSDVRER